MGKIYRSFRRMTEEEQTATGLPTDGEALKSSTIPYSLMMEMATGKDPFVVNIDRTWDQLSDEEKKSLNRG